MPYPWTHETARAALADWIADHGQPTKDEWGRSTPPGCPSTTTIRFLFGGWGEAMRQAGGVPLKRGQHLNREVREGPAP
jgi:hypothetical protein